MEFLAQLGMAIGFAIAAGFRAFLPLFMVVFIARHTELIAVSPVLRGQGVLLIMILLFGMILVEVLLDRLPGVGAGFALGKAAVQVFAGGLVAGFAGPLPVGAGMVLGCLLALGIILSRETFNLYLWRDFNVDKSSFYDLAALFCSFLAVLLPLVFLVSLTVGTICAWQRLKSIYK